MGCEKEMNYDCFRCKYHSVAFNVETEVDEIICNPPMFGEKGYLIHSVVQSFIARYGCKFFEDD
jgi:16S rRNA G1207 methylase RsmC